jgi:hypothetical protein
MPSHFTSTPTEAQIAAIVDYARTHGRRWKADLCADWSSGRDERNPLLRQLRNEFGPIWLLRFKLPSLPSPPANPGAGAFGEADHAI